MIWTPDTRSERQCKLSLLQLAIASAIAMCECLVHVCADGLTQHSQGDVGVLTYHAYGVGVLCQLRAVMDGATRPNCLDIATVLEKNWNSAVSGG